jgi:hypothetical protein
VEWTAGVGVPGDFHYCTSQGCGTCPYYGHLGGLAVGAAGDAVVGVDWGSCGSPGYGPDGAQLFVIDAAGTVTKGDDLAPLMENVGGMPAELCGLQASGASGYVAMVQSNSYLWSTSDTLVPDYLQAVLGPGVPVCKTSAIVRDAAGDTFATFSPLNVWAPSVVEKLDSANAVLWTVPPVPANPSFWENAFYEPTLAADGAGGVYLAADMGAATDLGCGAVSGTFVTRLDASGNCLWSIAPPALGGFFGGKILPADAGQVYVVSPFQGTLDLGCGPMSGSGTFVAKLGPCGACVWSRSFASPTLDVELFPGGDILLSASYSGTLDLGGGPLTSAGATSVAVGRLSASGSTLWSRSLGGVGASVAWGQAAADATGSAELVLTVTGAADLGGGPVSGGVLLKLDASGAFLWQHAPFTGKVAPDPCGAVIAASDCATCAPGNTWGVSVEKLAP